MRELTGVDVELQVAESREDRFRRFALQNTSRHQSAKPQIKIAENLPEWEAAFQLLYDEYLAAGYVTEAVSSHMLFGIHHFLPKTVVFVAKISESTVSTLTQFFDDRIFGLPADMIYKRELDQLRSQGRVISELGSLATRDSFRWQSLFMYLCQAMYWYSRHHKIDDLCIAVNPKHVQFYKTVFLFEEFGPERFYPKVQAPAVLMRLDLTRCEENLKSAYGRMEGECNLDKFVHKLEGVGITDYTVPLKHQNITTRTNSPRMDSATVNFFLSCNKGLLRGITPKHMTYLKAIYPKIRLLSPIHANG